MYKQILRGSVNECCRSPTIVVRKQCKLYVPSQDCRVAWTPLFLGCALWKSRADRRADSLESRPRQILGNASCPRGARVSKLVWTLVGVETSISNTSSSTETSYENARK